MNKTSTSSERKPVRMVKPSRRVINNILAYSKSLLSVSDAYGRTLLLVNN